MWHDVPVFEHSVRVLIFENVRVPAQEDTLEYHVREDPRVEQDDVRSRQQYYDSTMSQNISRVRSSE